MALALEMTIFRCSYENYITAKQKSDAFLFKTQGGDDFRNFEPVGGRKTLSFGRLDRIVRDLRRIYKENPAYFDVPAFAQKVY